MRIGIDLDDTIFCTKEQYKKYQKLYLKEKQITEDMLWNNKKYRLDYIKNNLELIFSDIKIKKDAINTISKLMNTGHEIYIMTARSSSYRNNMFEFTKQSIEKNNVPFDMLILTEKYKLDSCIKYKIELMIDNSIDIYNELEGKINVLLFDESNKYSHIKNRVSNWKEISNLLVGGIK